MSTKKSGKAKKNHFRAGKSPRGGERDSFPGGKSTAHNRGWFGLEARTWYVLLGLSVIVSILLYPNILTHPKIYKPGDVADKDIKASQEFLVEDTELTEKNRQEAIKAVLSVYDFDRTAANVVSRIKEAFSAGREYLSELNAAAHTSEKAPSEGKAASEDQIMSIDSFKNHFFEILDISSDDYVFDAFMKKWFLKESMLII